MSSLAISLCNAPHLLGRALAVIDTDSGAIEYPDLGRTDLISACGLAADATTLVCASTDPDGSYVSLLARDSLALQAQLHLPSVSDVHSLTLDGSDLIVVSTGSDEVLRIDVQSLQTEVLWQASAERADTHHLNAVAWVNGHLLCSGFGPKASDRWSSAENGYVFDITAGKYVLTGLHHPHSIATYKGTLYLCESSRSTVRSIATPIAHFEGYVRGLAFAEDGSYVVGCSVGRADPSTVESILNPADPGDPLGHCAIHIRGSIDTAQDTRWFDFSNYANEIYDVLVL